MLSIRTDPIRFIKALALTLTTLPALQQPTFAQQPIELATNPMRLGEEGISVRIPIGSSAQTNFVGGRVIANVLAEDGSWQMAIRIATSADRSLTAEKVTRAAESQLIAAHGFMDGQGSRQSLAKPLQPTTTFQIAGLSAARFALAAPSATGGEDLIHRYAAIMLSQSRFLTFDLRSTEPHRLLSDEVFEAVLQSTDFSGARSTGVSRAVAVEAGITWLSEITPEDLDTVLNSNREAWFRLYTPGENGAPDQELGYQRVRAWRGTNNDLNNPRPNRSGGDGIVVEVIARTLPNAGTGGNRIDAESLAYVSDDFNRESSKVTLALRDPARRQPATWKSIGARTGTSMSVNIEDAARSVRTVRPQIEGDGYVSQPIALLLTRLLAVRGVDGSFGFYAYRSDAEAVVLRRDFVTPAGDATDDRIIETRLGPDRPVQRTRVTRNGEIRWIELPDGTRWEPITLNRLVELWRSKGLPID